MADQQNNKEINSETGEENFQNNWFEYQLSRLEVDHQGKIEISHSSKFNTLI